MPDRFHRDNAGTPGRLVIDLAGVPLAGVTAAVVLRNACTSAAWRIWV
jgi:hypothetical protein